MSKRRGVLLSNIGTPESFQVKDVARYLREFLMDEEILTLPYWLRYFLVHVLIVPRRAAISAKNYQAIWTEEGSPLRVLSVSLKENLQSLLGSETLVAVGMRYGTPSIEKALQDFHQAGVEEVLLVPLYPQYARATTVSTRKKVEEIVKQKSYPFRLHEVAPFYADRGFIQAVVGKTKTALSGKTVDHYLMTYHGLPENQMKKVPGCLKAEGCCQQVGSCEKNCYRAQCLRTSSLIAAELGLQAGQWTVSFQSRLGRTEWIKPYTDDTIKALSAQGIKNRAVLCPSFVSDCLETLEEIGVQGAESFRHGGGSGFYVIPCLNEQADYLARLIEMTQQGHALAVE
jgi:ferrochelatase